jgi:very-short-patch-repair endonuclease
MPKPEVLVWNRLRNGQVNSLKFRRQYGVGKYILDFYCPKIRLAIEIDGNSHYLDDKIDEDMERSKYLSLKNINVIRFTNFEVTENLDGVINEINNYTTPNPS